MVWAAHMKSKSKSERLVTPYLVCRIYSGHVFELEDGVVAEAGPLEGPGRGEPGHSGAEDRDSDILGRLGPRAKAIAQPVAAAVGPADDAARDPWGRPRPDAPTAADGVAAMRLLDAMVRSIESGAAIALGAQP